MQFFKTMDHWGIRNLGHVECSLLLKIPEAGDFSGCQDAEERLFPSPLAIEEQFSDDHDEFLRDWQEFVADTLRDEFAFSRDTVRMDLEQMESMKKTANDGETRKDEDDEDGDEEDFDDDDDDGSRFQIMIPFSHGDAWFSALNQARLVNAERFQLYDGDGNLDIPTLPRNEIDTARIMAAVQNEFYGVIQEYLVEQILRR